MRIFVLGNGESRSKINIAPLTKHGLIYGCNAIYRDFRPDVLVTVDSTMAQEIAKSDYIKRWPVYTPYSDIAKTNENFKLFSTNVRLCAGVAACHIAIRQGATQIYMVGHDLGTPNGLINNVYKNTANYKKAWEDDESFNVYTPDYLKLFASYPAVEFIRVIAKQTYPVKDFKNYSNYKETKIETFTKNFA